MRKSGRGNFSGNFEASHRAGGGGHPEHRGRDTPTEKLGDNLSATFLSSLLLRLCNMIYRNNQNIYP